MKNFDPSGLTEVPVSKEVVYQLLSNIPPELILVGGQALAFWLEHYQIDPTPKSSEDVAYVSMDVDFLGQRAHVKQLAEIISGKTNYPSKDAITILCGQIFVVDKTSKTFMNIDVIHRLGNMSSDEVRARAANAFVEGNPFFVMHPLDVLISRVENYRSITGKQHSNGLRQVELSIEVAKHFVIDAINQDEKAATTAVEEIAAIARSAAGRYVRKKNVEIYDAIDPEFLATRIKNDNFISIRLPRLVEEIAREKNGAKGI